MLLSFFNKQYKRKRGTPSAISASGTLASNVDSDPVEHDLQEILGDIETEVEALSRLIVDSGRIEHGDAAVKTIRQQAVLEMSRRGVTFTPAEAASAIKVLPKVRTYLGTSITETELVYAACCPCYQDTRQWSYPGYL